MNAQDPVPAMPALVDLSGAVPANAAGSFESLLDVSLPVAIEIGRATMTVQEILELSVGSVVQLDRIVGEPVDVFVSDRRIAQGEVVVMGEHFGVRITRVLSGPGAEQAAA